MLINGADLFWNEAKHRDEVAAIEAKLRDAQQFRREAGDLLHRLAMSLDRRRFAGLALSESASDPLADLLAGLIRSFPIRLRECTPTPSAVGPLQSATHATSPAP